MRSAATFALALAATGAVAQFPAGVQQLLGQLSSSCQQTVLQLATSSDLSQCLHINQLLPLVTPILQNTSSSASLIPILDQAVSIECGQPGCSNSTLTSAVTQIQSGCASDLQQHNITNGTIRSIVQQYPLAREIICTRTSKPFNGTAPVPATSSVYNQTNGVACSTNLLTEVSGRVGQNISIPFFMSLYQAYQNGSIAQYGSLFRPTDLCNDCIFAAADLIGVAYPAVGNVTLGPVASIFSNSSASNGTSSSNSTSTSRVSRNTTIAQALDGTCSAQGLTWNSNGTLPSTITVSIVNSTFGFPITTANGTTTPSAQSTPIRRNVAAIKGRWIGQEA